MTTRQKSHFLDALRCQNTSGRPPIWLMRQAGRYMPAYRKIREKHSFLDMVKTPEVAAEVTLLPIREFGFDAAILFADILLITEALGFPVRFEDKVGPIYDKKIDTPESVSKIIGGNVQEHLGCIAETIRILKRELSVPLIGFCGAPFTVASYLIEGRTSKEFKNTRQWLYKYPEAFHTLLTTITDITIEYLQMQIAAGVDAIQIFDSWAHVVSHKHFNTFIAPYHKKICDALNPHSIPTISFCRGCAGSIEELATTGCSAISLDWTCSLPKIRKHIGPKIALQGNLDPYVLYGTPETIRHEAKALLQSMAQDPGYIFNLGHGVFPDISPDAVKTLVEVVQCQ